MVGDYGNSSQLQQDSSSSLPVGLRRNWYKLLQEEARLEHNWAHNHHHCCHHPQPILSKHATYALHCTIFYHLPPPRWRGHPTPYRNKRIIFTPHLWSRDKHGGCLLELEESVMQVLAGWPWQTFDRWNKKRNKRPTQKWRVVSQDVCILTWSLGVKGHLLIMRTD
jgi:hypothetical protein